MSSGSFLVVSKITYGDCSISEDRSHWHTSGPVILGISQSRMQRSIPPARNASQASCPLAVETTSHPHLVREACRSLRDTASSSAIRTLNPDIRDPLFIDAANHKFFGEVELSRKCQQIVTS